MVMPDIEHHELSDKPKINGQKISGRLSYAGISRNGRIYLPEELAKGDGLELPILLNHSSIGGAENIGENLLPNNYRSQLERGQDVRLGTVRLSYDPDTFVLSYEGIITDPFYRSKDILENLHVSQGIIYDAANSPQVCGEFSCFTLMKNSIYQEMSLVFRSGFPLVTLAAEKYTSQINNIKNNTMTKTKADECGCNGNEAEPSSAPLTQADGSQCPEGQSFNFETGKCEKVDTSQDSSPTTNQPPTEVAKVSESEEEDEEKGTVNADLEAEEKALRAKIASIEKAKANRSITAMEAENHKLKLAKENAELIADLKKIKDSATAKAFETSTVSSSVGTETIGQDQIIGQVKDWMVAASQGSDVASTKTWKNSKEGFIQQYAKYQYRDPATSRVVGMTPVFDNKAGEGVTLAPDLGRVVSNQVLALPDGKVVTPIRQFAETKILAQGETEAYFYDINSVDFDNVNEGTDLAEQSMDVRSIGGGADPRGKLIKVGYSQVEKSPFDLVSAINRQFALESVNDESKAVFSAYNDDTAIVSGATKPAGGGVKSNWIDGNGDDTTDDTGVTAGMTFNALLRAKRKIEQGGFDGSDLVAYMTPKAVEDVIKDPDLQNYLSFSNPEVIDEGVIARAAGINLIKSSAIAGDADSKRAVVFKPFGAFGLVVRRDLTMEAQRWNTDQTIRVTGTQAIGAYIKNQELTCRISYAE